MNNDDTASILVVDDDHPNLILLDVLLSEHGYRVSSVSDGESALKSARKDPPDLILLDIIMSEMDGYEVCERLKADARTQDIPIIFVSAANSIADRVKGFSLGGVDFIVKPYVKQDLLARISTHLGIRTLQQDLHEKNMELRKAKEALETANKELEQRVSEELKKRHSQQQLLIQKSKLESLGKLAAGIAHEINQPLSGISMGLDNIVLRISSDIASVDEATASYLGKKTEHMLNDVERISHIINHVRTFSRDQQAVLSELVDINEVCENALSMTAARFRNYDVRIMWMPGDGIPPVIGNKYKLEQVVLNLLANAGDAVEEMQTICGKVTYGKEIEIYTFYNETCVCLEVRDNGAGIPEYILDRVFEPFFTTKASESGTGIGLSISYGIVREMGGNISVESKEGEYTVMRVILPEAESGKTEHTRCG